MNINTIKEIYDTVKKDKIMLTILRLFGFIVLVFSLVLTWKAIYTPVKIFGIELNQQYIVHDTVVVIKRDTIIQNNYNPLKPNTVKNAKISVQSIDQKGGQTANEIINN